MRINSVLKIVCLLGFVLILVFACAIPFYFESPSMFYKFGTAKLMLRSGKIFGILAGALMAFQAISAARFVFLNKIFSQAQALKFHKINGVWLTIFAICHPVFILWAEGFSFFPFEKRYWPEFLGMGLLLFLTIMVLIAFFRIQIKIGWNKWLVSHRISALLVFFGVFVHASNVSKSFESGLPYILLLTAFLTAVIVLVFKWVKATGFIKT
ncbi:MAG: ferric reductase-like transmembrane domain-containing protein [Pseudomonadota bacterium]